MMDNRALTALLLIAVLLVIGWFTDYLTRLPLTLQTVIAVVATLAFIITAVAGYIVLRGRR